MFSSVQPCCVRVCSCRGVQCEGCCVLLDSWELLCEWTGHAAAGPVYPGGLLHVRVWGGVWDRWVIHIQTRVQNNTHTPSSTRIHVYIYKHTCTCMAAHTHTHTHTFLDREVEKHECKSVLEKKSSTIHCAYFQILHSEHHTLNLGSFHLSESVCRQPVLWLPQRWRT